MAINNIAVKNTKLQTSGLVIEGPAILNNILLGTDGVNDPTITIYDGTNTSGTIIVPETTYDASALGLNGATKINSYCASGIYIKIVCSGTIQVIIHYTPWI